MAFNEDTSFIEYPVDQPTQDFVTNFDTIGGTTDVVLVTVDGVLTDTPESSYTVQQINHTTWRVTPEVQTGSVVRLYRVTNIDEMMHVFTAGAKFIARNMDNNFKQIRHAQQEVRDAFDFLEYNTLGVIEAAKDATELAKDATQVAYDAVEQVDDKIAELQPTLDSKLQEFDLAINTIVVDGGVPALAVSDASGVTQQGINDLTGAPYRVKAGGYNIGERVVLENGDIVQSIVAGNIVNPNVDMAGWVNTSRLGKLVDTRLYGLKVNTGEDQTAAIHAAFAANPNSQQFYIPKGVVKANVVFPRAYMYLVGDGLLNTIIEPFDLTKPVVSFNKKLYSGLLDIGVKAPQEHTAESLIDATDVRYMHLENVDVRKTVASGQTHTYQGILIDNRPIVGSWTGYNKLRNVRGAYGSYGYLSDIDKLNSVLLMDGCLFSFNGYFNIKTSGSNSTLINMDVANGGKLRPADVYDETMYGGIYFKGDNSVILGVWHEINAQTGPAYNANNLYIDPTGGGNITHNFARDSRSLNNVRVYTQSQGQLQDVNTADRSLNDGQGRARPQQLIKNGNFAHWDATTNRPKAWSGYFSGTWTQETTDLPSGYNTGLKVVSSISGVCGIFQPIYSPNDLANSYIKDISKWIGREITVTFWVKNIGTSEAAIRGGISIDVGSVYFSSGNYIAATKVGAWTKLIASRKITGTETRIQVGVRVAGVGEGMIVAGFSVADDCRVDDSQPKPITEDGGEVFGNMEVQGTFTNNGVQPVFQPTAVTTTGLTNASGPINTAGKFAGKQVFNNTNSLMYYATGTTPTSPWKSFDSTNTITPA